MENNYLLRAQNIGVDIGKKKLLYDINLGVEVGEFIAIIGPNGAGKSTLLNALCGDNHRHQGKIYYNKQSLYECSLTQLAKIRAVLPQLNHIPFPIRAYEVVKMGRAPYQYTAFQKYDEQIISQSFEIMGMLDHFNDLYQQLSGGEQHRIQIARTITQIQARNREDLSCKILFLDEPTNHLDLYYQYQLMQVLQGLQQRGLTIIAVMHDIALALQYASRLLVLRDGQSLGCFSPQQLIESGCLSAAYNMEIQAQWLEEAGRYVLLPKIP